MELTPELFDQYLTVARRQRCRALKVDATGAFAVELEPDPLPESTIETSTPAAGGWKRPADLTGDPEDLVTRG